jgi:polyisoprenoid-binding protein YceI
MTRFRRLALLAGALVLTAGLAQAAPTTYTVDAGHSGLLFRIKHLNIAYTYGRFDDFSGTLTVDDDILANAKVEITAKVTSVNTGDAKRDAHLRSPDFFNVAQFPTMTYRSTSVTKADGGYKVEGNLTLHGVTKPVTVTMRYVGAGKDPWGNTRIGYEGAFTIQRSAFGMTNLMEVVGDQVDVTVGIEAVRN